MFGGKGDLAGGKPLFAAVPRIHASLNLFGLFCPFPLHHPVDCGEQFQAVGRFEAFGEECDAFEAGSAEA